MLREWPRRPPLDKKKTRYLEGNGLENAMGQLLVGPKVWGSSLRR